MAHRQQEVQALVQEHRISLLGLVETKVKAANNSSILQNLLRGWRVLHNYEYHPNGRIWVLWNPTVMDINLLHTLDQMVHVSATFLEKQHTFQASFVYGFNTPGERLPLWADIMHLRGHLPWILLGDFNIVRFPTERTGGNMDWPPYMDDLNIYCSEAHLEDLKATGFHLTWDNKGSAEQYKSRKLDRVLVNPAWHSLFPLSEALFLPRGSSDHSPMTVSAGINVYHRKTSFKFSISDLYLIEWISS